jgi:hypothetical protein
MNCNCRTPKGSKLPPGWHWCRLEKCVVTERGVRVPLVDNPLVGTPEEREALAELQAWEALDKRQIYREMRELMHMNEGPDGEIYGHRDV